MKSGYVSNGDECVGHAMGEMAKSVLILAAHKTWNCHISFAGVFNINTNERL